MVTFGYYVRNGWSCLFYWNLLACDMNLENDVDSVDLVNFHLRSIFLHYRFKDQVYLLSQGKMIVFRSLILIAAIIFQFNG